MNDCCVTAALRVKRTYTYHWNYRTENEILFSSYMRNAKWITIYDTCTKATSVKKFTPELTFCRINFVNVLMATMITCCCLRVHPAKNRQRKTIERVCKLTFKINEIVVYKQIATLYTDKMIWWKQIRCVDQNNRKMKTENSRVTQLHVKTTYFDILMTAEPVVHEMWWNF